MISNKSSKKSKVERALRNYEIYNQLAEGEATIDQVQASPEGLEGWAKGRPSDQLNKSKSSKRSAQKEEKKQGSKSFINSRSNKDETPSGDQSQDVRRSGRGSHVGKGASR